MSESSLSNITKGIRTTISKHGPEILTGVGITGMITTVILAVRATPKALELMGEEQNRKIRAGETEHPELLTPLEIVRVTWKCYIPAAITGGLSVICLISANSVNVRRSAALATAYTLSESALKEYQGKVIETIGEKKEQAVRDAIAKDKVERDPVSSREVIITDKGNTLCYDAISGRYFKSDIEKIKKAANEINRSMLNDMYVSLNDFYNQIGLTDVKIGDDLGWNVNNGLIDLTFSSLLADDGTPCLVLDYRVAPRYDYYK